MPRLRLFDKLQNFRFWLLDISPTLEPPFFVFLPLFGFQSISGPGMNLTTRDINQGNLVYPTSYVVRTEIDPIVLRRGASFYDSEFWNWASRVLKGEDGPRDLMLIHFTGYSITTALGAGGGPLDLGSVISLGPLSFPLMVPARAWKLYKCLPTRYKVGDFDATDSEVSINELEIKPEAFEEWALTA